MLMSEQKLVELLFVELEKTMRLKPPRGDVVELFLLLRKQCLLSLSETKMVDLSDYDLERECIRYAAVVLDEFDRYYERWIRQLNWLQKIIYCVANHRGRNQITAAQEWIGLLLIS